MARELNAALNRRKAALVVVRARGFSLIELVVVVTIVSIMSLGVVLGFGGGAQLLPGVRAGDPGGQARRFEAAVSDAAQSALFGSETMGLQPLDAGWEVLRYDARLGAWQLAERSGALQLPLRWSVSGLPYPAPAAREVGSEPPIRILGDGRITPFTLRLGIQAEARLCAAQRLSELSCHLAGE